MTHARRLGFGESSDIKRVAAIDSDIMRIVEYLDE